MPRTSQLAISLPGSPEPWKRVRPVNCPAKELVRFVCRFLASAGPSAVDTAAVERSCEVSKRSPGVTRPFACVESAVTAGSRPEAAATAVEKNPAMKSSGIMICLFIIEMFYGRGCQY